MGNSQVVLDQRQLEIVERLVRTGRFTGVNDVLSKSLGLLEEREAQAAAFLQELEAEIDKGLASGPDEPMESARDLLDSFRKAR